MVSDGADTGPEVGRIAGAVLVVIPLEGAATLADAAVFDGFGAAFSCLRAVPGVGWAVTTAGVAARATPAGLTAQPPAAAQLGAGVCVLVVVVVCPAAELAECMPPTR
jgi:hypothetical protein